MRRFKHVYYNFLFSIMQKPFLTGLKLKNSLTNQLVTFILLRNSFNPEMAEMCVGILVDLLSTHIVTLDTPGKYIHI